MSQDIQINAGEIAHMVYLSSAYLAPVQYYSKLMLYPQVKLEAHCNYIKQTYRSRCDIAAANGQLTLSIPVDKGEQLKCRTKDIRIANTSDWQRQHWKSIESAYRTSPFFEYYEDDFRMFYEQKWDFLFDFNTEIQAKVLSLIDCEPTILLTDEYKTSFNVEESDMREAISPKRNWQTDEHFKSVSYYQVFEQRHGFLPNLSIIDLLFNMGNETRLVLLNSFVK